MDYFSRYQQHHFIVKAIVDGRKRFLDFASGSPGSIHDARVLQNSTIFDLAEHDQILTCPSVQIGGNDIKPNLVGDNAYPLTSEISLLVPLMSLEAMLLSGRLGVSLVLGCEPS